MKKRFTVLFLFLMFGFIFILTSIPVFSNSGMSSGVFLTLDAGARPAAMAGAFTSLAKDVNSIFYNPAGLAEISRNEFTFMHNDYLQGIKYEYIAFCHPTELLKGNIGVNLILFDAGSMNRTLIDGFSTYTSEGTFGARDSALGLSYGIKLFKNFNFGISTKFISSKIDDAKTSAVAFDVGIQSYQTRYYFPFKWGVVLQNFGTKLQYDVIKEDLPTQLRTGISFDYIYNPEVTITPAIDLVYSEGTDFQILLGSEIGYKDIYFARFGFNNTNDAGSGITFGAGASFRELSVDYAFASYGDLDNSHIFSLSYRFGPEIKLIDRITGKVDGLVSRAQSGIGTEQPIITRTRTDDRTHDRTPDRTQRERLRVEDDDLLTKLHNSKLIYGITDSRTQNFKSQVFNEAYNLHQEGKYSEAIRYYKVLQEFELTSDIIFYNLSLAFFNIRNYNKALEYINKALQRNPHDLENKLFKLYIADALGNRTEVMNVLNNLSSTERQNPTIRQFIDKYSR